MNILGIDLSIRATGLAMLCTADPEFPDLDLPADPLLSFRWQDFMCYSALAERTSTRWVDQVEDIVLPILAWANYAHQIVIEEYSIGSNSSVMDKVHELGGIVKFHLAKIEQTWLEISPSSMKKFIAGHGHADKDMILRAVQKSGAPIVENNMADAFGLARVGHALLQPEASWAGWHHTEREAIHKIKYPVVKVRKSTPKEKAKCAPQKLPGLLP